MSTATYFVQECPTCARRLQVRVEYLGKRVVCQHCRGTLVALDPANKQQPISDSSVLLARADQLLATTRQSA
jgi:RNase P subunit RPR2